MYLHSNKPVHSWDRIHLVLALSVNDDDGDAYDDVDDYADCLLLQVKKGTLMIG